MEQFGGIMPAAAMAMVFAVLWMAAITEANRLEDSIMVAAADVARELEAERSLASATSPVGQDIGEARAREKASLVT